MSRRSPLLQLYFQRLREFYRQPARIFWVYGFPLVMATILGWAFQNRGPEPVFVDVVAGPGTDPLIVALDRDRSAREASGRGQVVTTVLERDAAMHRLTTGKSAVVVEARPDGSLTYHFDPTRAEAVVARARFDDALQRALGRIDKAQTADQLVTKPGARYIDRLIPGLIAVNAMGGGLWGIGFLLVNFRIGKLLKRFAATPMPRRDFLLALFGARLTFLLPDLIVLLSLGVFAFQMPVQGNLGLVVLVDAVGALAFAGIGMLIAGRAQTTESVSGLMNLVMLPQWLFSGVFFSSARFPDWSQPFVQALPLTQLVDALRAVILEGAGPIEIGSNLLILGAWALGSFLLALRIFRWS